MGELIEVKVQDGVKTIRMNRPEKKNAITAAMYQAMADHLVEAYQNDTICAVAILGTPGAFTAGNDILDFMQIATGDGAGSNAVFEFLEQIIGSQKPVVAGVDGLAIGVGTTMLLHCDYVVASTQSQFKTPFVDLGLVPEAGSSLLAPMVMGHHRAFEMLALGHPFTPEQAQVCGFVNQITSSDHLEDVTMDIAVSLAQKPPQALKITRDLLRGDRSDILKRMRAEAVEFGNRLKSEEARNAFMAFMQKSG